MLCHFASLALEFLDSWAGGGEQLLWCWKVFLQHFYVGGRTKYSWEALWLQFQLVALPPALSCQLKWNRFINTHGGLGRNIPCDLHNEHMNKLFKEIVKNMCPNLFELFRTASLWLLNHCDEAGREEQSPSIFYLQ